MKGKAQRRLQVRENDWVGISGLSSLNYNCQKDRGGDVLSSRANIGQLGSVLSWWVNWVVGTARAALYSLWCVV